MTPSGNKRRKSSPQTEQSEKRDFFLLLSYLTQFSFAKMRLIQPIDQSICFYDNLV